MSGDYSRFTFDPKKNYSSVLKQQGRVSLDADANEAAAIQDRRWRAETMDIFGHRCVVPDGAEGTNSNAFEITPSSISPGDFCIGFGRIYVDGLLAENHGIGAGVFDPSLEEMRGRALDAGHSCVSYRHQPHYPLPPDLGLPEPPASLYRTDLVYLDVWKREVTAIEDADITEVALDGPDTSTRVQTIWQVKFLQGVDTSSCDTEPEAWAALTAPSSGRLSVTTVALPTTQDPCELSPEGGYRGKENRLYRVEIHAPATEGNPAKFKWSRDNASVVAAVEEIEVIAGQPNQRRLRLSTLGRDRYLRFSTNDWIELLDEHRELHGRAGEMLRIVEPPDEAERTVVVEAHPDAFDDFDASGSERHTRVRRWDHGVQAGPDGLVDLVLDTPVLLESGIQLHFGLAPPLPSEGFKVGDYWVFDARTTTGEVEELTNTPPRGIHHHYCWLALIEWPGPHVNDDCRTSWPPAAPVGAGQGCCTFVVEPGQSIQGAITNLPPAGGCVCLRTGTHELPDTITIDKSNVVLQGESPGAQIRGNVLPLLSANKVSNLNVRGLRFEWTGPINSVEEDQALANWLDNLWEEELALISISSCRAVSLSQCILERVESSYAAGILVQSGGDIRIEGNEFQSFVSGVTADQVQGLAVTDNVVEAEAAGFVGILALDSDDTSILRNRIENYYSGVSVSGSFLVENNVISGVLTGIYVFGGGPASRAERRFVIEGNTVHEPLVGSEPSKAIYAIGLNGVKVRNNHFQGFHYGIELTGTVAASVKDNRVRLAQIAGVSLSDGLANCLERNYLGDSMGGILALNETGLEVNDNTISNIAAAGLVGADLGEAVTLSRNRFLWCGWIGIDLTKSAHSILIEGKRGAPPQVTVESCYVLDTGFTADGETLTNHPVFGVWIGGTISCRIQSNELLTTSRERIYQTGDRALSLAGMTETSKGNALVLDNRITGIGRYHLVEFCLWHEDEQQDQAFERVTFSNNVCEHSEAGDQIATVAIKVSDNIRDGQFTRLIVMGNSVITMSSVHARAMAFDFDNLKDVVLMGNVIQGRIMNLDSSIPTSHDAYNSLID